VAEHEAPSPGRVRLLNTRAQPCELVTGSEVLVVPSGGQVEVEVAMLGVPQVAYLLGRRFLRAVPAGAAGQPPAGPVARSRADPDPPARRTRKAGAKRGKARTGAPADGHDSGDP
jgi:hypothetical protein